MAFYWRCGPLPRTTCYLKFRLQPAAPHPTALCNGGGSLGEQIPVLSLEQPSPFHYPLWGRVESTESCQFQLVSSCEPLLRVGQSQHPGEIQGKLMPDR